MGFLWSKSEDSSSLSESLVDSEPTLIFRTADILIARASEMEIVLSNDFWAHLGIVVLKQNKLMVFSNCEYTLINDWLNRHRHVVVRHCHCIRPSNFDRDVLEATERVFNIMLRKNIDIDEREAYCIGTVLGILNLVSLDELSRGQLTPFHFSSSTPYDRLNLQHYSENWVI